MSKYIDAEKLKAEIKRRINTHRKARVDGYIIDPNRLDEDEDILSLVTSLQQEQPEFPTTDEEVEKVIATIPKVELPDKYKTPDWLFKQQEQPEVDLGKACDAYCKVCGHYPHTTPTYICRQDCDYFRDFEASLNARKEDEK